MKTYIVLPFKDRNGKYQKALDVFIYPFYTYLNNNLSDFEMIIVEQNGGNLNTTLPQYYNNIITNKNEEFFNLGRTINIGFDILKNKIKDNDIFIFHPVDILPVDVNYNITNTTKFCYKIHSPDGKYYKSIGFKCNDFKSINGFSNNYWGWGLEDDDLFTRINIKNILVDTRINNYNKLTNDGNGLTDDEHYMPLYNYNHCFINEIKAIRNCNISGLNTISYKILKIEETYENIKKYIIE